MDPSGGRGDSYNRTEGGRCDDYCGGGYPSGNWTRFCKEKILVFDSEQSLHSIPGS